MPRKQMTVATAVGAIVFSTATTEEPSLIRRHSSMSIGEFVFHIAYRGWAISHTLCSRWAQLFVARQYPSALRRCATQFVTYESRAFDTAALPLARGSRPDRRRRVQYRMQFDITKKDDGQKCRAAFLQNGRPCELP